MALAQWLNDELARLESRLQGSGPTCRLDAGQTGAAIMKADEGRHATLRLAARLLERAEPLDRLDAEAAKAQAFLDAAARGEGLARNPLWSAYFTAVRQAVLEVQRHAGPSAPPPSRSPSPT